MALTKVSSSLVSDNAITTGKLVDGGVHSADIATNAITSTKIAQNSILTKHIDDGQVTTAQLGADAVTAAKIADDAISEEHLDVTVITGLTEVTAATGDLLMVADISDSNNLKKIPVSSILAGTLTNAAQTNITSLGTLTSLNVDTISMNGSSIAASGNLTLDVTGNINLDADGGSVFFKDAGTEFFKIRNTGSDVQVYSARNNADIIIEGVDDGIGITALRFDMSEAGAATFNDSVTAGSDVEIRSGNKLILQRPNNAVASIISTDSTGAMILDSLNSEGFFFNNNGTNIFKLDPVNATFAGDITLGDDLNFSTNGFADISNTGTGAMRFKPTSQTLALTLTGANATFAGTISSGAITSSGYGVFTNGAIDPDSFTSYAGGIGNIADGSGWGARGLFVHGGGTGDAAAIAHNGNNLYFGIQNGSAANSMATWMEVTPARVVSMSGAASVTLPNTTAGTISSGNISITKEDPFITLTDSSSSRTLMIFNDNNNSVIRASGQLLLQVGSQSAITIDASRNATFAGNLTLPEYIYHEGDSNTYLQFNAADSWRVVTGGEERIKVNNGEVVVNDNSADMDFRVETNGSSIGLLVDGTSNNLGIQSGVTWSLDGGGSGTSSSGVSIDMSYDGTIWAGSSYWAGGLKTGTGFWSAADGDHYKRASRQVTQIYQNSQAATVTLRSATSGAAGAVITWQEMAKFGRSEIVFNDGGLGQDFRIESDTVDPMLLVDASTNRIGIGTNSPQTAFDVETATQSSFVSVGIKQMSVNNYAGIHFGYKENNGNYRKSAIVFKRTDLTSNDAQGQVHILNGPQGSSASATLTDSAFMIDEYGNNHFGRQAAIASEDSFTQQTYQFYLDAHVNGTDEAAEEKDAVFSKIWRKSAVLHPGKYSNGNYYVGIGVSSADTVNYVTFKVNLYKATQLYSTAFVANSADGITRANKIYYSTDDLNYTQGASNNWAAGGNTVAHTLAVGTMSGSTSGYFTGTVYLKFAIEGSGSGHTNLIGWHEFNIRARAQEANLEGGGFGRSKNDLTLSGQANTGHGYAPLTHSYGHAYSGTNQSAIVSANGGLQSFATKGLGHEEKAIFNPVSSPVQGLQVLASGVLHVDFNQDIITTGSTSYVSCTVKRHNDTNANAQTIGSTLRTNTDGQWDMIQGSYICDVVAGDIITFTYNATGITSMDGGQWANYNFTLHPSKTTSQGNAGASTLPWIHQ